MRRKTMVMMMIKKKRFLNVQIVLCIQLGS